MRLDPINIILNKDFKLDKKFYFISGNEKTLIGKISTKIIEKYQKKENIATSEIDSINDYVEYLGLFEDKKIILIKNCKGVGEEIINNVRTSSDIFIFVQENSQKIKKIKNIFLSDKNSYLIDCYELDKGSKIKILNKFIELSGKNIEGDIYWFLVERLDNKYVFLENTLNKILGLDLKDISHSNLKRLLNYDESGKEKVFFSLYKKNKEIVVVYREKVVTSSDVSEFFYYCKNFCQLIIDCKNEEEYNKKIPVYLFKEKSFLIDVFRKYTPKKKRALLKLISATEKVLRKEASLSLMSGLRFLLNIKKITIS